MSRNSQGRRWLRLVTFLACIFAASAWWKVRQVKAELNERTLSIGRQIESWRDPAAGTSTIRLNGSRLTLTSVSSEDGIGPILDRFTRMCANHSGGIREAIQDLIGQGADIPAHVATGFGVLRAEPTAHEGSAACFARAGAGGMTDLARRVTRLAQTGDLAALGQLRYVFARRRPDSSTTHVLTVISHDSLPIEQMFPARGDVPGTDIVPGVRPERARRLIAAELEGGSQRAAIYEVQASAQQALQAYDAALPARGFERGDLSTVSDKLPGLVRVYFKQRETLLVIAEDLDSQRSHVSAFRLADGGFVSVRM